MTGASAFWMQVGRSGVERIHLFEVQHCLLLPVRLGDRLGGKVDGRSPADDQGVGIARTDPLRRHGLLHQGFQLPQALVHHPAADVAVLGDVPRLVVLVAVDDDQSVAVAGNAARRDPALGERIALVVGAVCTDDGSQVLNPAGSNGRDCSRSR